jgi:hypothetical protein
MKNKLDPRTGRIINRGPKIVFEKLDKQIPAKTYYNVGDIQHEHFADTDKIISAIEAIKEAIVDELKAQKVSQTGVTIQTQHQPQKPTTSTRTVIDIDESIVDVGIGDTGELKKGSDTTSVGKEQTEADQTLSNIKAKLQALKDNKNAKN